MINGNMTSCPTCVGSTCRATQDEHVKGQHDKEHQDEQVHPQVTIAVPDVGEENSGQAHHHLIGEKPRWPILLTLFNFEESAPFGVLKAKLMTLLVSRVLLRKPPLKKSKVPLKYQVSLFILILIFIITTTTKSHRQSFRFYFTAQLTLKILSIINFVLSICAKRLAIHLLLCAGH